MTLDEAREHIGSGVIYRRVRWDESDQASPGQLEDGVITSVNDTYVFVRYRGDTGSKATRPTDLVLLRP